MNIKKYQIAVNNNFPNTNTDEVSSAEIGRELRAMLKDELKISKFPNKKELQLILANTAKEAITKFDFELFTSSNQLKRKSKDYVDILGFYYVRGQIDPIFTTKFLWLEKLTKKWIKENNLEYKQPINYTILSTCNDYFQGENISFNSYYELSEKYITRLQLIESDIIPKHEKLKILEELNHFLNYGNKEFNSFSGEKRFHKNDKKLILPNPIIAVLAQDKNANEIFDAEVIQHIENIETKTRYLNAFEKLKNTVSNNGYN